MRIQTLTTNEDGLLHGVRETLAHADDALLCVAFASRGGVQLLEEPFTELGARTRLLVTTAFGSTTQDALNQACDWGVRVSVLNPAGAATYHPKLYLARRGDDVAAVVGSANLTQGLVGNVEVGVQIVGRAVDAPLRDAWSWAERLWSDPRAERWAPGPVAGTGREGFDPELWTLLTERFEATGVRDRTVATLGPSPRPNRVTALRRDGLHLETRRTLVRGAAPQFVPAWMFNIAWAYLRTHRRLTNAHLLNVLRVHRSSAVCALLSQLEPVVVLSRRPIALGWRD